MTTESPTEGQMSLMEHLNELRTRIIRAVVAIFLGAIVAWIFYPQIFDILIEPHCQINGDQGIGEECGLLAISPLEGFSVRLTVVGYGGLALAMPFVLWQVWQFIAPGLYPHEKRYGVVFVALSAILFASGAWLAYWSLPRALEFLANIGGDDLTNISRPKEYIGFVTKMMIGFGLGFLFPILLIFLQLLGIVDNAMLRSGRRFAIVGIVALVAVLTPSGDPGTLMALSVPMYLFYEIAILFGWWRARRQAKAGVTAT